MIKSEVRFISPFLENCLRQLRSFWLCLSQAFHGQLSFLTPSSRLTVPARPGLGDPHEHRAHQAPVRLLVGKVVLGRKGPHSMALGHPSRKFRIEWVLTPLNGPIGGCPGSPDPHPPRPPTSARPIAPVGGPRFRVACQRSNDMAITLPVCLRGPKHARELLPGGLASRMTRASTSSNG